ncbi:MAG: Type II secretion system protein E [Parcubacteria group bacterium Gr01-1014_31]|nr:MAG: Type II secretion system protein E [Parcubacteria group bacterium Gr01-1014_31]
MDNHNFSAEQLKEVLITQGAVSNQEFDTYLQEAKEHNTDLLQFLESRKIISEPQLYRLIADFFKVPFIDLKGRAIRKDILLLIPEPIAQAHRVVAFDQTETELKIAALNPRDLEIFDFLGKKSGREVSVFLTTPSGVNDVLKSYHKGLKAEFGVIGAPGGEAPAANGTPQDLKELAQDLPVIRIVDTLLEYAIYEGASDIHIEPGEKEVSIRYRIDGILRNVMTLPKPAHAGVIARIKILADLKLDEHRLPQDGRFKVSGSDYNVSLRVSIIPTFDGEKVVLRLLNEKAQLLTLEQLGIQVRPLEIVKRNIAKPHGMILVTGPTGSGKTTTLYTILSILNTPEVNISTIEDPIEYRMPRVNQSQVNPKIGYTFATGLRAFLRQDPNIIMVGEIRDGETAEIAVHAAMTGHLVLSTLHTNDAVTSLPRLVEMGVPSFLIGSTTNVIIAQRLVRKICQKCIYSYTLDQKGIKELEKALDLQSLIKVLEREKIITPGKQTVASLLFYRGKGCRECNQEGYKGRIGIYEVLEVTPEIQSLIIKNANADELFKAAIKQEMLSIMEDGFIKAKNGVTSVEEVLRVTQE